MSSNRFTFIIFTFAALSLLTATSLTLTGSSSELTLENSSSTSLEYSLELGDIDLQPVMTPAGNFTRLSLAGYHRSLLVGEPELPELHQLISIPYNAVPRIEIIRDRYTDYSLSDLGFSAPVYPAQPPLSKSQNRNDVEFVMNAEAYALDTFTDRAKASVEIKGFLRGIRIANFILRPVEYNPTTAVLRIHTELEVRVYFDDADLAATATETSRVYSPVFEPIYSLLANYDSVNSRTDLVGNPITFVIIANSMFEGQLDDFINWKTQEGYTVITGYTNEIGSSTAAIKAFIQDLYENPADGVAPPSFVLFVGDVAQLPTWNGNTGTHVTDTKYCEFTNDYMPEIYFGRFSAANTSQLQAILDKTLEYEQYTMPDPSYLGEAVMIAGMDSSHGSTWGNGQINYGTTYYFNPEHGISSFTYLYPNSGSNSGNIITNISEGVGYANYTAHGSQTSWSDPSFTISDINGLENQDEYPLVVGNCCLTNAFDTGTCFGEAWLRAENKGAIGYIGGSNSTYWDEDYWWGVGSGAVVSNPTFETTGPGAYDGVFHDHNEAESEWYVTSYAMIMAGNLAVVEAGGSMNYYWEIYQLMGDPSLSAYMGVPSENTVDYLPILQIGLD
ncbi:MAG: gingipain R, partial [FCB group bacterium]|nr:gingipain R [FCB group bacterium]